MAEVYIGPLLYDIDEYGNISKRKSPGYRKCFPDKDGYLKVAVNVEGKTFNAFVHRLVYQTFNGEIPVGMTVDHIDNNRLNNHKDNLQLLTVQQNSEKGTATNWIIEDPDGKEYKIYNLAKFCREYNLHRSHMADGKHKKWKCRHDCD